jgi:hypothetical protein
MYAVLTVGCCKCTPFVLSEGVGRSSLGVCVSVFLCCACLSIFNSVCVVCVCVFVLCACVLYV